MSYIKFHDYWNPTDYLSAGALNHIESQWDEIKEDADKHNHDDVHYTKTECNTKFFTTSYYTNFDADMLDGQHFSDIITTGLPVGSIVVWKGDIDTIPPGWVICNGQTVNGIVTPDLRQRFVVGAGNTYAVGATGGSTSTSVTASITVVPHAITANEMPIHTHSWVDYFNYYEIGYSTWFETGPVNTYTYTNRTTSNAGDGLGHTHTGNTITFNDMSYEPYYYSLYYIIKVV